MTRQAENRTAFTVDGDGLVEEFGGKTLGKPIKYSFSYEKYPSKDDAVSVGQWPNDATILENENTGRERRAKASEYQKTVSTLRDVKACTYESQRDGFIAAGRNAGMSQKRAEAAAASQVIRLPRHDAAAQLLDRLMADFDSVTEDEVKAVVEA